MILVIITICWLSGFVIGFLPLMGWHQNIPVNSDCLFLGVMDYNYLVFLYFTTIITPALLLAAFYAHIYRVVLKQLRTIVTMNPKGETRKGLRRRRAIAGGTMLRVLGAAQKREVKATQNLSIIVLFFMICWIPLYTINFILALCRDCIEINSTLMLFCIILSHLNSAGNPILYAYHLKDFRAALKNFLCSLFGKSVNNSCNLNTGFNCRPSLISNAPLEANNFSSKHHSLREMQNFSNFSSIKQKRFVDNSSTITSNFYDKVKHQQFPSISTIVTKSTAVAVIPTAACDTDRKIWRISEVASASDVALSQECSRNPSVVDRRSSFLHNLIDEEGDDDVFVENCRADSVENLALGNNVTVSPPGIPTNNNKNTNNRSCSSPQLSKGLFLVEEKTRNKNTEQRKKSFPFTKIPSLYFTKKCSNLNFVTSETNNKSYSGSKGPP